MTAEQETKGNARRRTEILKAAAELFAEHGYDATGVAELGNAVDLGRGSLYYYIGSKENLLYEICARQVLDLLVYGEKIVGSDQPASDKLRALGHKMIDLIAMNRADITVFFNEYRSLSEDHRREILAYRSRFEDLWSTVLQEGVSSGDFQPHPPLVVKALLGAINYSYVWIERDGNLPPEEIADMFVDLLLDGLRG